jgi:uncharacterized protein YkwD
MAMGMKRRINSTYLILSSVALAFGCSNVESDEQLGGHGDTGSEIDDADAEIGDESREEGGGEGDHGEGNGDEGQHGEGDGDGDEEGNGDGDGELPNNSYCQAVADWNPDWASFGVEVVHLINQARAEGGNCGFEVFAPAPPLEWNQALACAARSHAADMAENDFFDAMSSNGKAPDWRYEQAGFAGGAWAELIGAGYPSPAAVVEGWLKGNGQCVNLRSDKFSWIGVGYAYNDGSAYKRYWTASLGAP